MRPDGPIEGLNETQRMHAKIAGIPADRAGLGAEYPKMVYRNGSNPRHMLLNEPLRIGNGEMKQGELGKGYECETALVDSAEDEAEALAAGWFLSPVPAEQAKQSEKMQAERAKDDEIAQLKAQLAAQAEKRGPGRPPKNEDL